MREQERQSFHRSSRWSLRTDQWGKTE